MVPPVPRPLHTTHYLRARYTYALNCAQVPEFLLQFFARINIPREAAEVYAKNLFSEGVDNPESLTPDMVTPDVLVCYICWVSICAALRMLH